MNPVMTSMDTNSEMNEADLKRGWVEIKPHHVTEADANRMAALMNETDESVQDEIQEDTTSLEEKLEAPKEAKLGWQPDGSYIQKVIMTKEEALKRFPEFKEQIEKTFGWSCALPTSTLPTPGNVTHKFCFHTGMAGPNGDDCEMCYQPWFFHICSKCQQRTRSKDTSYCGVCSNTK